MNIKCKKCNKCPSPKGLLRISIERLQSNKRGVGFSFYYNLKPRLMAKDVKCPVHLTPLLLRQWWAAVVESFGERNPQFQA